jgi:arylsulfatase B
MYEGGLRVPFLVQWPGTLPAGRVEPAPVISLDIYATAAAAAGAELPRTPIDGVNLLPLLLGESTSPPHESLYWRVGRRAAVRVGEWKALKNPGRGGSGDWQLYDLAENISESQDLAATRPAELRRAISVWNGLDAQMQQPSWRP